MDDVIVVGAGPTGSIAATVLARAGARVRLVDRAAFPRPKLCGDTVNPGALSLLRRLGLSDQIEQVGLRVDGMRLTGPRNAIIEGRYPNGLHGCAILRRDLDHLLVQQALAAGAFFEPGVTVRRALPNDAGASRSVRGVVVETGGRELELRAPITIAADGRRSTLAFGLGLASHPTKPRRWAIGAYYENVSGLSTLGEMHIRRGRYLGVAQVPGGLVNVCLVTLSRPGDPALRDPTSRLAREIAGDPLLDARFGEARLVQPPVVLGPLAVDVGPDAIEGLLLAGDAAGFVDPMTGDGLRFAVRGGELAARAALDALDHGWHEAHRRLAAARRLEFGSKCRFNRALRAIVASPAAVDLATMGARVAPGVLRHMITMAGDCGLASNSLAAAS